MITMKKQTKSKRGFQSCVCKKCGDAYNAPLKIRGKGVIGDGLCPNCIRAERPAREVTCPVDGTVFKVQQGHSRETCCRDCQRINTLRLKAADEIGQAPAVREAAQAEADRLYGLLMQKREAEAAARTEARHAEAKPEQENTDSTEEETEQAEDHSLAHVYRTGGKNQFERLAAVTEVVTAERMAQNV